MSRKELANAIRALSMARLRLTVAYDGTALNGWQLQAPGLGRTVQGCLEEALARLCGEPVRVHGAGRTDAGVHALAQTAHVDVPASRAGLPWQRALGALLPPDIAVIAVTPVPAAFHARFSARGKTYAYTLWTGRDYVLPWRRAYVWNVGRQGALETAAMDAAATVLVGEHDFAAFQNAGSVVAGTVRRLTRVLRQPGACPEETVWRFSGTGFLKQMVRNLMPQDPKVRYYKIDSLCAQWLEIEKTRTIALYWPEAPADVTAEIAVIRK